MKKTSKIIENSEHAYGDSDKYTITKIKKTCF